MNQHDMQTEKADKEEILEPHCASCNMPMTKAEDFGTDSEGERSDKYCCHCMQGGNML